MHVCMHLVCFIGCGCHKFTSANQKKVLCAMLFRDGHSLEVVPNLCFVTLMDVSKHMCELL